MNKLKHATKLPSLEDKLKRLEERQRILNKHIITIAVGNVVMTSLVVIYFVVLIKTSGG